ncbi:MAG: YhcH/YjgK/YiaL family protein [Lachnospiraceae bacterium]|nr:YhcH/YjgK/YiaL family protein [Lachnospiraceae bacterium]
MIYTEMENLGHYQGLGECLDKAVGYLCSHDLGNPRAGRYEIDGDSVYMNVFDYETLPEDEAVFEAHRDYADIHLLVSGEECVGVSDRSRVTVANFDETQDFFAIDGAVEQYVNLVPGKVLILLPEDAHKVKIAVGSPSTVKKVVVKVLVK